MYCPTNAADYLIPAAPSVDYLITAESQADAICVAQVPAAALLLDHTLPGWERRIDVRRLDISNGYDCILGQLFGGFGVGMNLVCDTHRLNPFHAPIVLAAFQGGQTCTDAWAREIRMRHEIAHVESVDRRSA